MKIAEINFTAGSLLTAAFFVLFAFVLSAPVRAGTTYDAKSYAGAVGNGTADDSAAIQKTIDAAIAAGPGNTVLLPAGRYLISKQLVIDKAQGLTFTGAPGSPPLLLTTPQTGFVFTVTNSDHVTINNIANDAQVLNFTQGTITAFHANPPSITVRLDAGYSAPDAPNLVKVKTLTTFSDPSRAAYDPHHPAILSKSQDALGVWTFTLDSPPVDEFVGEKIAVWNRDDNPPGLLYNIGYDSNTTLSNIRDYCGGWNSAGAIYSYSGENFLTNFYEGPPPGSNRLITSGGGMVGGGRGNLTLTGCDFRQIDDDCVDLGNGFDHIISQEQPNVITVSGDSAQAGDTVQVWSWASGDPYIRDTVKITKADSVETKQGRFKVLTLDRPVTVLHPDPTGASHGNDGLDTVQNVSASGALTFRGCRFQSNRARGMLLHPSGPLTIDHCTVHGCRWLGIFIGVEQEDYEGAAPSRISVTHSKFYGNDGISCFIGFDNGYQVGAETHTVFPSVTVSGNSFVDTDQPNASIGSNPGQYDWPSPLLVMGAESATISDNFFRNNWGPNIFLQSDNNIRVTNNTFVAPNQIQGWPVKAMPTDCAVGADLVHGITLAGNVAASPGPYTSALFHPTPTATGVLGAETGMALVQAATPGQLAGTEPLPRRAAVYPPQIGVSELQGVAAIAWPPVPQATSYSVGRATTPGGPYTVLAAGLASGPYDDPNCPANTACYYVVNAAGVPKTAARSNEVLAAPTSSFAPVNIAGAYDTVAIEPDHAAYPGRGIDGAGFTYSSKLVGRYVRWGGSVFALGAPGKPDAVTDAGQRFYFPEGRFSAVQLLAAYTGANTALFRPEIVYSDGPASFAAQAMSNWCVPAHVPGESNAARLAYTNSKDGKTHAYANFLHAYTIPLDPARVPLCLILPNTGKFVVLAMDVTGKQSVALAAGQAFGQGQHLVSPHRASLAVQESSVR